MFANVGLASGHVTRRVAGQGENSFDRFQRDAELRLTDGKLTASRVSAFCRIR